MMPDTERNNLGQQEEEQGLSLEEYGLLFLSRWYYFVAAVIIAMTIAVFKILTTTPVYQRNASVLIKDDDQKSSGTMQEIANLGIISSNTNINNEILTISAPVLMQEATKRLGLDLQISIKEGLHSLPLYNNAPVSVVLDKRDTALPFTFNLKVEEDKSLVIHDFTIYDEEEIHVKDIKTRIGQAVQTPVGKLIINETPVGLTDYIGEEITVTK